MSTPERRHFTPVAKVAILRKHLLEAQPVSEVCTEAGIAVSQFYQEQAVAAAMEVLEDFPARFERYWLAGAVLALRC